MKSKHLVPLLQLLGVGMGLFLFALMVNEVNQQRKFGERYGPKPGDVTIRFCAVSYSAAESVVITYSLDHRPVKKHVVLDQRIGDRLCSEHDSDFYSYGQVVHMVINPNLLMGYDIEIDFSGYTEKGDLYAFTRPLPVPANADDNPIRGVVIIKPNPGKNPISVMSLN